MKNSKLYIYTTIGLILFSVLVCIITIPYLLKINGSDYLTNTISLSKAQVEQLSLLNKVENESDYNRTLTIGQLQNVVKSTESDLLFLSIVDWSGKILCYPDITRVGQTVNTENAQPKTLENSEFGEQLYQRLKSQDFEENKTDVIYLKSIEGTDLIIAANININIFKTMLSSWQLQYYILSLILTLLVIVLMLGTIRITSNHYQAIIEEKNTRFEDGVLSISKLNDSLESYQNKLLENSKIEDTVTPSETAEITTENEVVDKEKRRILTYVRNELVPIPLTAIAYIYVENTITYIIRKDGKRSTSNDSLDQIYSNLDSTSFFRVNRQIIVAISAIDKILKFGNSQLKIQVTPPSEIDIVIGKNKASAFKQWLDM